jgi:hypothetical protein
VHKRIHKRKCEFKAQPASSTPASVTDLFTRPSIIGSVKATKMNNRQSCPAPVASNKNSPLWYDAQSALEF